MLYKKILLLGDFNVGKTSLIRRFVDNSFDDKYLSTIGVKISKKHIDIEGKNLELLIWDIEGDTPQKPIPSHYFRGASGAIFVVDVVRKKSMKNLLEYIEIFKTLNPQGKYVIAYNKVDLLSPEKIEKIEIEKDSFLTSAKEGLNVNSLFETLASKVCQQ